MKSETVRTAPAPALDLDRPPVQRGGVADRDPRDTLAQAVADVGFWRWWDEIFPNVFQLEFGGVQLWSPPTADDRPPNGQYGLRFPKPVSVSFLTAAEAKVPADWADQLHADKLRPFNVGHDSLTFRDADAARHILAAAGRIDTRFGEDPWKVEWEHVPALAAFWAGPVGCLVAAPELKLIGFAGEIPLADVPAMAQKWWDYWKEYWRRKDTPEPFPRDYACEVTIPMKEG